MLESCHFFDVRGKKLCSLFPFVSGIRDSDRGILFLPDGQTCSGSMHPIIGVPCVRSYLLSCGSQAEESVTAWLGWMVGDDVIQR